MAFLLSRINGILRIIDLFGIPNSLALGRTLTYKSKFSGVVSSFIYIFIFSVAINELIKNGNREQANITSYISQSGNPDTIKMNHLNGLPAFRINQPNFLQNPFYQLRVRYFQREFESGKDISKISEIQVEPCTFEHFIDKNIDEQTKKSLINDLQILNLTQNFLCVKKNSEFNISGSYGNEKFNYVRFSFDLCLDRPYYDQTNVSYNPTCGSEIEFLQSYKSEVKIELLYMNKLFTPLNSTRQIQRFIDNSDYFKFNPSMVDQSVDLFYRKYNFMTSDDPYRKQIYNQEVHISKDQFDEKLYTNFKQNASLQNNDEIVSIYIRRSPYSHYIYVHYQNFLEVMVYIGGLRSFILAILGVFLRYYNSISLLKTVANNTYSFLEETDFEKMEQKIYDKLEMSNVDTNNNEIAILYSGMLSDIISKFKIKLKYSLTYFCKFFKGFNIRRKIYSVGMELIYRDFNITRLIKLMHDVERLKFILLSKQQYDLFNLLPKPMVIIRKRHQLLDSKSILPSIPVIEDLKQLAFVHPLCFNDMYERMFDATKIYIYTKQNKNELLKNKMVKLYKTISEMDQKQKYDIILMARQIHENQDPNYINYQLLKLIHSRSLNFLRNENPLKFQLRKQHLIGEDNIKQMNELNIPELNEFEINYTFHSFADEDQVLPIQLSESQQLAMIVTNCGGIYMDDQIKINFFKKYDSEANQICLEFRITSEKKINIQILNEQTPEVQIEVRLRQEQSDQFDIITIKTKVKSIKPSLEKFFNNSEEQQVDNLIKSVLGSRVIFQFEIQVDQKNYLAQFSLFQQIEQIFMEEGDQSFDNYQKLLSKQFSKMVFKYQNKFNKIIELFVELGNLPEIKVNEDIIQLSDSETLLTLNLFALIIQYILEQNE